MEIRQLEAFVSVVREGSFTQAAERLNLTQPSLSARIRQLERSLDGELFTRQTRPIQLTPAGKTFLPYAERILGILEAGQEALRVAQLGLTGRLAVGCPVSVSTYLMPQVVNHFSQTFPQAELFIETSHSANLVQQLTDGLLDMAFTAAFPHLIRDVEILLRLHDEIIAAVRSDHPLAHMESVAVTALWDYRLVLPRWGTAFEAYVQGLRELVAQPKPMVRVPLAAALPMIQQPETITFVPRRVAQATGLAEVAVPGISYPWDVVLVTRQGRQLSELERGFLETVKAVDPAAV